MNLQRHLGASVVRVRILTAGLVLLAAACLVLGGSHSRPASTASAPAIQNQPFASDAFTAQGLTAPTEAKPTPARALSMLAALPMFFEPNQGQANLDPSDPRARFVARGSSYSLFLGSDGATLSLSSRDRAHPTATRVEALHLKLAASNPSATLTADGLLPGQSNYFLGNDPAKWRHGIPQFARVRYEKIYPGIDLVFYGNQGKLEYDFQVAPGSDPSQAELEFDGVRKVELQNGALVLHTENNSVRFDPPRIYQQIAGREQTVEGSFVLRGSNRAGFAIGPYDHSRELVIDPVLKYSTYFGGTGNETNTSVAIDNSGAIYLAGSTESPNLPTSSSALPVYQATLNGVQNVYIAKLNPTAGANGLIYVTYLGGSAQDYPVGIALDGAGDPFVAGTTTSPNFPTTASAYQTGPETGATGPHHAFVTGLNNSSGVATELIYSTYLSGNGDDVASGMTIDSLGYVYVTGTTTSTDTPSPSVQFPASTLPQPIAFQSAPRASKQFFVTKVNSQAPKTGSIAYSTYFGGGNFTPVPPATGPTAVGGGIAVDNNGNIYFTGTTNFTFTGCAGCSTTDFPILNAYQPCLDQPPPVVIVNPPTCSNTTNTSNSDAFIAKLNNPNTSQGSQLLWSTYFGGSQTDSGTGIALDTGAANVYITGTTNSPDVTTLTTFAPFQLCLDNVYDPATKACKPPANPAPSDAFVARLTNPATTSTTTNMQLTYFSYLGGANDEQGNAITVDTASGALITGWTKSPNPGGPGSFPVVPPNSEIQSQLAGTQNAFVARLNTIAAIGQNQTASWSTFFGGNNVDEGTGIALDVNQNTYVAGDTTSTPPTFPVVKPYQLSLGGGSDSFVAQLGTAADLQISGVLNIGTDQTYIAAGNPAQFTYTLTNGGPDLATNITFSDDLTSTVVPVTFVSASTTSGTCTSPGSTTTNVTCNILSLQSGSTATITITLTPTPNPTGSSATFNGGTVQAFAANNISSPSTFVPANMSDFAVNAQPGDVTLLQAGDTAVYQVQLSPKPVYPPGISLSCANLPTGAACNFTTTPVTLVGTSPGGTTLNITTTPRPVPTPVAQLMMRHYYAIWLAVPGLAVIGLGAGKDRRRRRILGLMLLCVIFAMLLLQPACSSATTVTPPSGTPAGNYFITVAAKSGSDTKNATVELSVP